MTPESSLSIGAYQVSGATLLKAGSGPSPNIVILTTSPLSPGTAYRVTARDLRAQDNGTLEPNPATAAFIHGEDVPGSYIQDFESLNLGPAKALGTARIQETASQGAFLELTSSGPDQRGSLILNDINAGKPVYRFTAGFDVGLGGGTFPAASGFSFCLTSDFPNETFGVEGPGSGLVVSFDSFDVKESAFVEIKLDGKTILHQAWRPDLNSFHPVRIALNPDGALDLAYNGSPICTGLPTGYAPQPGRFGFGASTENFYGHHWIDNVDIRLYSRLGPVMLLQEPSSLVVNNGDSVTFTAVAEGTPPHCFQWEANHNDIPGATNPSYTFTASPAHNQTVFRVRVNNEFSQTVSESATLTVVSAQLFVTRHPLDQINPAGTTASFMVAARAAPDQPIAYQWQKRSPDLPFTNIEGATTPFHVTKPLTLEDGKTLFRCAVSIPGLTVYSKTAALYVTPDRSPPRVIGGSSVSPFAVDVCFSDTLSSSTVNNLENYRVSGANVVAASLQPDGRTVQLTLDQATLNPIVTVNNIADTQDNALSNPETLQITTWASSADVGFPAFPGTSVSCRVGEVTVQAGDAAQPDDRTDTFRFVYLTLTNDFDVAVAIGRFNAANPAAGAGLMARESLSAQSPHLAAFAASPGLSNTATVDTAVRKSQGEPKTAWGSAWFPIRTLNWLRLRRVGNLFSAFHSPNGTDWTRYGDTTIHINPTLLVGMAANSGDPELLTTAEYHSFQILSRPTILQHPQGAILEPGILHSLSVVAGGVEPILYQWRRNGQNIPGATDAVYPLPSSSPKDGGIYDVIVFGADGAVQSDPAEVIVLAPPLPLTDNFGTGAVLGAPSASGSGQNFQATTEPGEPTHAKFGGASVWLSWVAQFNGVATFSTLGSGFDTLLAAYAGERLDQLTAIARDDDDGGFGTSTITFNALQGQVYHIAVDGYEHSQGNIVLCWELRMEPAIPRIFQNPINRVAPLGAPVEFEVGLDAAISFQWFFNNQPIPGANEPLLLIPSVTADNAGSYFVEVSAVEDGRVIRSKPADLEIGPPGGPVSRDKLADLYRVIEDISLGEGGGGGSPPLGVPVAAGTIETRILNNSNSTTSPGEPSPCGVLGGASRWFGPVYTPDPGMFFEIDTLNSSIDTVLAVYTGPNLLFLTNIACAAGPGNASTVRFPAQPDELYNITVDGINGATGTILLNYKLGVPPLFTLSPMDATGLPGSSITLTAAAAGTPAPAYQWQQNGADISGEINPTLTLTGLAPANAGVYSVIASNFMGTVTNSALVLVGYPFLLGAIPNPTNSTLLVQGPTNALATNHYILQATIDFSGWSTIWTNQTPLSLTNYFDPDSLYLPRRFYRAYPWP